MDLSLLVSGVLQLFLSLMIGVIFIYAGFRFFHKRIKSINEIEELKKNNIAVAILNASIILALVIMVKNAIEPAITVFSMALRNPDATLGLISSNSGNNDSSNNSCRIDLLHFNLSRHKLIYSSYKRH